MKNEVEVADEVGSFIHPANSCVARGTDVKGKPSDKEVAPFPLPTEMEGKLKMNWKMQ